MNYSYFLNRFNIESAKVNYLIASDKQDRTGNAKAKQGEYLVDFMHVNGLNILKELQELKEVLNVKYKFNLIEIFLNNLNVDNVINELKLNEYKYHPQFYKLYPVSSCWVISRPIVSESLSTLRPITKSIALNIMKLNINE